MRWIILLLIAVSIIMVGFHIKKREESYDVKVHNEKGIKLYWQKRYDDAVKEWERAIELDSSYPNPYNNIGIVYKLKGRYKKAIIFMEKALEVDPSYAKAHYSLSETYYTIRDYERAISEGKKALKKGYCEPQVYCNIAWCYRELSRFKEAIEVYREKLKRYPEDETAYYMIGSIYKEHLKNYPEASTNYKRVVEIFKRRSFENRSLHTLKDSLISLAKLERRYKENREIWKMLKEKGWANEIRREDLTTSYSFYYVKFNETLWSIASKLYKDPMRWPEIYHANKISNPNLIYPGQALSIPEE